MTKQKAYEAVFETADSFEPVYEGENKDLESFLDENGYGMQNIDEVMLAKGTEGEAIGYAFTITTAEGYGGDIQVTVGITADGTVSGVSFLSISETAGLGMKATEASFYEQYVGVQTDQFYVSKDGGEGEPIDALSGATITTRAVTGAVNAALAYFQNAF